MADVFPCHSCGRPTHIDLLDAKPRSLKGIKADRHDPRWDTSADYSVLECRECYGPAWLPGP